MRAGEVRDGRCPQPSAGTAITVADGGETEQRFRLWALSKFVRLDPPVTWTGWTDLPRTRSPDPPPRGKDPVGGALASARLGLRAARETRARAGATRHHSRDVLQ